MQARRVGAVAEAGKKRCGEWLGIVDAKLSDGRAYVAGDEFTAAGDARTPTWLCVPKPRLKLSSR